MDHENDRPSSSSGSLRFKISLSKREVEHEGSRPHSDGDTKHVTSNILLKVLTEIHNRFVKRDSKGIFAQPVTAEIAPDYFSVIFSPMDLSTIFSKLKSRKYYRTAFDYLSDLRLMCTNAMSYNPPNTIYHQCARKMLIFGEKQLAASVLQRTCTDLGLGALRISELGDLQTGTSDKSGHHRHHHHRHHSHHHDRFEDRHWTEAISTPISPDSMPPPPQLVEALRFPAGTTTAGPSRFLGSTDDSVCSPIPPYLSPECAGSGSPSAPPPPPPLLLPERHRPSPPHLKVPITAAAAATSLSDFNLADSEGGDSPRAFHIASSPHSLYSTEAKVTASPLAATVMRVSVGSASPSVCTMGVSPTPSSPPTLSSSSPHASTGATIAASSPCVSDISVTSWQRGDRRHRSSRTKTLSPTASTASPLRRQTRQLDPTTTRSAGKKFNPRKLSDATPKKIARVSSARSIGQLSPTAAPTAGQNSTPKRKLATSASANLIRARRSSSPTVIASASPQRVYAEDAWSFSDSLTDLTPPNQVLVQITEAAARAKQRVLNKYYKSGWDLPQRIVHLDTSQSGKIFAVDCPLAATRSLSVKVEPLSSQIPKMVNYPGALLQLLTGRTDATELDPTHEPASPSSLDTPALKMAMSSKALKPTYHGLIEQMTSQEVSTLHALSTLRYSPDEPIARDIHGPLAIFDRAELAELYDAYGGDPLTVEYVLSYLNFVEPLGVWARRAVWKRLDLATMGLHSEMLSAFGAADNIKRDPSLLDNSFTLKNWMATAGLTIDPPLLKCDDESDIVSLTPVSVLTQSSPLPTVPTSIGASSTRQTATVQPLQRFEPLKAPAALSSPPISSSPSTGAPSVQQLQVMICPTSVQSVLSIPSISTDVVMGPAQILPVDSTSLTNGTCSVLPPVPIDVMDSSHMCSEKPDINVASTANVTAISSDLRSSCAADDTHTVHTLDNSHSTIFGCQLLAISEPPLGGNGSKESLSSNENVSSTTLNVPTCEKDLSESKTDDEVSIGIISDAIFNESYSHEATDASKVLVDQRSISSMSGQLEPMLETSKKKCAGEECLLPLTDVTHALHSPKSSALLSITRGSSELLLDEPIVESRVHFSHTAPTETNRQTAKIQVSEADGITLSDFFLEKTCDYEDEIASEIIARSPGLRDSKEISPTATNRSKQVSLSPASVSISEIEGADKCVGTCPKSWRDTGNQLTSSQHTTKPNSPLIIPVADSFSPQMYTKESGERAEIFPESPHITCASTTRPLNSPSMLIVDSNAYKCHVDGSNAFEPREHTVGSPVLSASLVTRSYSPETHTERTRTNPLP